MRVLYVAAEAAPLIKFGGLGDVAGSLPLALKRLGVDVRVAIPWFKDIDLARWGIQEAFGVGETRLGESEVPVYLLSKEVFDKSREEIMDLETKHEKEWYARFCDNLVDFIALGEWKPQVLHGNDWHVSQALVRLEQTPGEKLREWGYEERNFATLLTLHNLYHTESLRAAVLAADMINAVSPSYAKEILTPEFCAGLCEELTQRKNDLYGVLNGIDYGIWDPAIDKHLAIRYAADSWKVGKEWNKGKLRKELGLSDVESLLIGFVGRLDPHQKGVLVLANAIGQLVELGVQIVILGSGDSRVERQIVDESAKHRGLVSANILYDEGLAHRIYAGTDAILIPSKYEPCGLIQMIAMKYGSLPIAHEVGGLGDSIDDGRTGFLYKDYYVRGLVRAVERALKMFSGDSNKWAKMVEEAMAEDFSWERSAKEYMKLYERALEKSRVG